jgi:glutamine amidotransferase
MICVVDYGVGNVQAFLTIFKQLGIDAIRANSPAELTQASHLILPGVGHFDHAMRKLHDSGMKELLEELVLAREVPILGVCVGMQMLASGSDEGSLPGLDWIPGRVRSLSAAPYCSKLPMPHMGWNELQIDTNHKFFKNGFIENPPFYFLHSYYFDAHKKSDVIATAHYGMDFDVIVAKRNIYGIQCHPEKSHHWGLQLLKNFVSL